MSTLKVEEIQHISNSNNAVSIASDSSVSLKHSGSAKLATTSTGVSVTGTCTATGFSGDGSNLTNVPEPSTFNAANLTGALPALSAANLTSIPAANITGTLPALSAANLTSIPAANLTGTLPAIDGSNLTGVGGGGALEFVSKTTISTSNSTTQINFTGLDHGYVYKVVCKIGLMSGVGEPNIYFYYDDGSGNASSLSIIDYVAADPGSQVRYSDAQSYVRIYTYGYEANNWEYEMDFHTGYYGWFRGTAHPNGGYSYAAGHGTFWGHLDPSNYATKRIAGISCRHGSSRTFQAGTEIILYKYKES